MRKRIFIVAIVATVAIALVLIPCGRELQPQPVKTLTAGPSALLLEAAECNDHFAIKTENNDPQSRQSRKAYRNILVAYA